MKRFIIALAMLSTPAMAQQATPVKEYNLKITADEVTMLGDALGYLPYSKVAPLFQKLQQQINIQNTSVEKPKEEEKK